LPGAAAAGVIDRYYLDEAGFAPTWPTGYTWAPAGVRPLVRYEAPQRRRVNALGARAPVGPRPRFVFESRSAAEGKLDSAGFLDFVCRELAGLPGGAAALAALPPGHRRARPCVVVLDNYQVHKSAAVKAAAYPLAAAGVLFYYLPPYSPELNRIEAEWRAVKYEGSPVRSHATAEALKEAVDAALAERAARFHPTTPELREAA
jgi:DDE superfamily endonuclease